VDSSDVVSRLASAAYDVASFDELYRRDYLAVVALVYGLCGSRSAAEELTQDAFVAAHRRWSSVSAFDDPGAWVRNVAMNNARSAWRRRTVELRALSRLGTRRVLPAEMSPHNADFWHHVRKLPKQQAKVVALFYIEDRSVADIALALGCSEGAVKTHLSRARERLAESLKEER
jgi:RNA polymerase sigma-70 factor (ECF subfamily)